MVLEKILKVPWTARKSNQSILREINPEYALEGLMLKLKLQYFGHLMQTVNSLEKSVMLGKIEGGRKRGRQSTRWLDGITDAVGQTSGDDGDREGCELQSMRSKRAGHHWATEQQQHGCFMVSTSQCSSSVPALECLGSVLICHCYKYP